MARNEEDDSPFTIVLFILVVIVVAALFVYCNHGIGTKRGPLPKEPGIVMTQ